MREIKFRGYNKENKKWIESMTIVKNNEIYYMLVEELENGGIEKPTLPVEEDSIGQYTGFKDTINKEIYEGDIVELEEEYVVVFDEYRGQWMLTNGFVWDDDVELRVYYDNCIVIGNIYEEKLKEK